MSNWYRTTFGGLLFGTSYTWSVSVFVMLQFNYDFEPGEQHFQAAMFAMYIVAVLMLVARLLGKKPFARESKRKDSGFTLTELLIVISIIGILSAIAIPTLLSFRHKAYLAKAKAEFRSIETSLELYYSDNLEYPSDTNRDIPPGLEDYLAPGIWPDAAWPGSVLDWDNWVIGGEQIYQISARFCPIGQPSECQFPDEEWAEDFDISSAVYYCLEGPCRSHSGKPIDHPGYCVNCNE